MGAWSMETWSQWSIGASMEKENGFIIYDRSQLPTGYLFAVPLSVSVAKIAPRAIFKRSALYCLTQILLHCDEP